MSLTEGETRALLASSALVILAAIGRMLLQTAPAEPRGSGLDSSVPVDSALAVAESVHVERRLRGVPLAEGEKIDPNRAGEVELDRLPGVGPALARAIVESRRQAGPFRDLADLERVPGLGSRSVERLAPYLSLPDVSEIRETPGGSGRDRAASAGRPDRLNLNEASVEELESLPGIGPARARAIVRWREEQGLFRELEELLKVPGIGPATLERLRPLAGVGP